MHRNKRPFSRCFFRQARMGVGAPFCAVYVGGFIQEEDCPLPACPGKKDLFNFIF